MAYTSRPTPGTWVLGVVVPCLFILVILGADSFEGPKTAYVGVLTAVPLFSAIFGTPVMTAIMAVITWLSALSFGLMASDGNVPAQTVRLTIIALAGIIAVFASYFRRRREQQFQEAQATAAQAEFLRAQATHDDLTGLLNRRGLFERMNSATLHDVLVVEMDCDDFKEVNDTYGHAVGDEYLQGIAGRLAGGVSRDDAVARWGGDEFLLVLSVSPAEGEKVVKRIIAEVMARPMHTHAGPIPVSISTGAARMATTQTFEQAVVAADRAMYAAKAAGAGQLVLAGNV